MAADQIVFSLCEISSLLIQCQKHCGMLQCTCFHGMYEITSVIINAQTQPTLPYSINILLVVYLQCWSHIARQSHLCTCVCNHSTLNNTCSVGGCFGYQHQMYFLRPASAVRCPIFNQYYVYLLSSCSMVIVYCGL